MFNKSFFRTLLVATALLCVVCGCDESLSGKYYLHSVLSPVAEGNFTAEDIKEIGGEEFTTLEFFKDGTCRFLYGDIDEISTYVISGNLLRIVDNDNHKMDGVIEGKKITLSMIVPYEIDGEVKEFYDKITYEKK